MFSRPEPWSHFTLHVTTQGVGGGLKKQCIYNITHALEGGACLHDFLFCKSKHSTQHRVNKNLLESYQSSPTMTHKKHQSQWLRQGCEQKQASKGSKEGKEFKRKIEKEETKQRWYTLVFLAQLLKMSQHGHNPLQVSIK